MERMTGFEPAASTLARSRSSQLSYTRIKWRAYTDSIQLVKTICTFLYTSIISISWAATFSCKPGVTSSFIGPAITRNTPTNFIISCKYIIREGSSTRYISARKITNTPSTSSHRLVVGSITLLTNTHHIKYNPNHAEVININIFNGPLSVPTTWYPWKYNRPVYTTKHSHISTVHDLAIVCFMNIFWVNKYTVW